MEKQKGLPRKIWIPLVFFVASLTSPIWVFGGLHLFLITIPNFYTFVLGILLPNWGLNEASPGARLLLTYLPMILIYVLWRFEGSFQKWKKEQE